MISRKFGVAGDFMNFHTTFFIYFICSLQTKMKSNSRKKLRTSISWKKNHIFFWKKKKKLTDYVFYLLFMHICSEWKKIAAFANDLEHAYVLLCHPSRPPCDVIMFKSLEYTFLYTHYTVWKKQKFTLTWKIFREIN